MNPRSMTASSQGLGARRDAEKTLVAPHPAPLLLLCLVAPASMPALLGQKLLGITSRAEALK
jgi:hypothetical protein